MSRFGVIFTLAAENPPVPGCTVSMRVTDEIFHFPWPRKRISARRSIPIRIRDITAGLSHKNDNPVVDFESERILAFIRLFSSSFIFDRPYLLPSSFLCCSRQAGEQYCASALLAMNDAGIGGIACGDSLRPSVSEKTEVEYSAEASGNPIPASGDPAAPDGKSGCSPQRLPFPCGRAE